MTLQISRSMTDMHFPPLGNLRRNEETGPRRAEGPGDRAQSAWTTLIHLDDTSTSSEKASQITCWAALSYVGQK